MQNRFTALGSSLAGGRGSAAPGEAIVWQSLTANGDPLPRRTFVVDVGQTKVMGARVSQHLPRIIVLTHDDGDHIGGFDHVDETALSKLEELWVPFEWGALLFTLARGLDQGSPGFSDDPSVDNVERVVERLKAAREQADVRTEILDSTSEILRNRAELAREAVAILRSTSGQRELFGSLYVKMNRTPAGRPPGAPRDVAERALERAEALIRILGRASKSGVSIRFFSVDIDRSERRSSWAVSGYPGEMTIMNAVEVGTPRTWGESSIQFVAGLLTLTVQNQRALCTLLWSADGSRGRAAVWSDSAGDWLPARNYAPLNQIQISSAPHHGSPTKKHDRIWHSLAGIRRSLFVVCAGGNGSQKGVHASFLAIEAQRRGCTRCRHGSPRPRGAQDVVINLGSEGAWALEPACPI